MLGRAPVANRLRPRFAPAFGRVAGSDAATAFCRWLRRRREAAEQARRKFPALAPGYRRSWPAPGNRAPRSLGRPRRRRLRRETSAAQTRAARAHASDRQSPANAFLILESARR